MWLIALASSLAAAQQQVELGPADHGMTVTLRTPGDAYLVDLTDRTIDLDQLTVAGPNDVVTFGEVFDGIVAAGAEVDEVFAIALEENGAMSASFVSKGPSFCRIIQDRVCTVIEGLYMCFYPERVVCCQVSATPQPQCFNLSEILGRP
jgi:hypothetical protein